MNDANVFRTVVLVIAAVCAISICGVVIIEAIGRPAPPILGAVATTGLGALCGILVRPPDVSGRNNMSGGPSTMPQLSTERRIEPPTPNR